MEKKKKIGILSDSPFLCTGYSDQSKYLGNMLVENGYDVTFFAHTYTGQDLLPPLKFEDGRELKFRVVGQSKQPYFKDVLTQYVKMYEIDVLVILLDTFMTYPWLINMDLSPVKTIFWFPSDGGSGLPLGCENVIKRINAPVAMAKFGQKQVKECHGLDVGHIPHSIDTSNFGKIENKEELKKKWGLEGKYVIGTVARNQGRKFLDRTIKAFSIYSKQNPDAVLLLHLDPDDPAQPFPITELIKRYKVENKVMFTGTKYYRGFNFKDMKEVYNLMDVFLLTTSGEGFGIPIIEAMACEVPVLATDYTTTPELVLDNKAGLGIKLVGTEEDEVTNIYDNSIIDGTITGSWAVERGICSIKDCVFKLNYLYHFPEKRKEMGRNGRLAVLENYDINKTKDSWLKLIKQLSEMY